MSIDKREEDKILISGKENICKNCFWWRHQEGKKICNRSQPSFSCKDWADKKVPRMCANCANFNNYEECDSTSPDATCMWHVPISEAATLNLPAKGDVREMLKSGKDPLEISKALGFEVTQYSEPPTPDDNQIRILKHHLNTILTLLPVAEVNARGYPTMNNIYGVTALIGCSREIMDDINNRQDPGEMYARLVKELLEPLTTSFLEVLTANMHDLRGKSRDIVQQERLGVLEQLVTMMLKNTATEMQAALVKHLDRLKEMLGVTSTT